MNLKLFMDFGLLWRTPVKRRGRIEPQRRGMPARFAGSLGTGLHTRRGDGTCSPAPRPIQSGGGQVSHSRPGGYSRHSGLRSVPGSSCRRTPKKGKGAPCHDRQQSGIHKEPNAKSLVIRRGFSAQGFSARKRGNQAVSTLTYLRFPGPLIANFTTPSASA